MRTKLVYVLESTIQQGQPLYFQEMINGSWQGVALPHGITKPELTFASVGFDFHKAAHYDTIKEASQVRDFIGGIGYGYFAVREHEYGDDAVGEALEILNQ